MTGGSLPHYLAFGSSRAWLRLLLRHGVSPRYLHRALLITLLTVATAPLRGYERWRYAPAIAAAAVPAAPLFVLGHPRSGTTHLHYLLARDPQFAYLPRAMSFVPDLSLTGGGAFARWYGRLLPATRPFDSVGIDARAPAEEEFALLARGVDTFLHYYCFPDSFEFYLRQGLSGAVGEAYLHLIRKVSLHAGGRRLVLKNPMNTARIRLLLDLFPDARFVHIVRDPYAVFASTRKLFTTEIRMLQLRAAPDLDVDEHVLRSYEAIMRAYLARRALIPPGRLVEIRYEDLDADPIAAVTKVYRTLSLPGLREALPFMEQYLATTQGFRKNHLPLSKDDTKLVATRLAFALAAWGY